MRDEATVAAGPGTESPPAEKINGGRARIDELDMRIIDLVRDRIEVSKSVQAARIGMGGPRVQHARELDIVTRYRTGLGTEGASLALLLLQMARGQRASR